MNVIQRIFDREVNTLTLEVLTIFENMVILGFYQSEQELLVPRLPNPKTPESRKILFI